MLVGLNVRDIVLISSLDLTFPGGLCVLTGETGTGKSIVLDALSLATGARGDSRLVRHGASQGVVTAEFDVPASHPAHALLSQHGLEADGRLILRRVLGADGRGRAFVNDQPVSIALLGQLGQSLVEYHGQHGEQGLFNAAGHRQLLDSFGGLEDLVTGARRAHDDRNAAVEACRAAQAELAAARAEEEYLRHVLAELDDLEPTQGEAQELAETRAFMMHGARLGAELSEALADLGRDGGVAALLRGVERRLDRASARIEGAEGPLQGALKALQSASVEAGEAVAAVEEVAAALDFEPHQLEQVEDRLHALRGAARKHKCQPDELPPLHLEMTERLAALDMGDQRLDQLQGASEAAQEVFARAVQRLGKARAKAGKALDKAVNGELTPLKLDKAGFRTVLEPLDPARWSGEGAERVEFQVSTNTGAPFGPISKVASGGELSRFMLAIKVALARRGEAASLVFDEIDRGIGGAAANAVGERLAALARDTQVLVVTHSPQVAARAGHHWRIDKHDNGADGNSGGIAETDVVPLDDGARREEIARMLSGAKITDEARAAADKLLQGQGN